MPRKSAVPGGLAVGILSALKRTGGVWFGWDGDLVEHEPGEGAVVVRDGVTFATIELQRKEFNRYYNGFANEALWPLFHGMPSKFRYRPEEWQAYQSINGQFARRLLRLLQLEDFIWVHDYHLIPLASRLRDAGVRSPIGFFLHIPFPYIETLRVLPTYSELVRALLQYDVVGFQTLSDLRSFLSAVEHVIGTQAVVDGRYVTIANRTVRCDVFPIGIDVAAVEAEAASACRSVAVHRMVASLLGRKLVIGVDRLDYSKGLVERFAAYEHFLQTYPEHCGRLTYLQIAPLSRKDIQSYVEIRRLLEQASGRTNGRFGDTDWTPIRYLNRNFPHVALMGLLRAARVGLVTPLRDGMNLVAKEYLAAQDPADPGVLVLSNLAGAAHELTGALLINPYDPDALGAALQRALAMPLEERRERHAEMLNTLRQHSVSVWVDRFIAALQKAPRAAELR